MVKRGFCLSTEKKIFRDTNHDCWWFCFPPDTDNGISGHAWKSQKGEFPRRWKPFTKPAPLYHFPLCLLLGKAGSTATLSSSTARKGSWDLFYAQGHALNPDLPSSASSQAWSSSEMCPPAASPPHFLTKSSQGEAGTGVTGRSHPAPSWLGCLGPKVGACWRAPVPWSCLCCLNRSAEAETGSKRFSRTLLLTQEEAQSE